MRYLRYDPNAHIKRILIVGVGGTGSVMARHVGSILFDMQQRDLDTPQVYLIDGDTVDRSNCGRQPFSRTDIGGHKAQLVAQRLNYALGLDIIYDNRMFTARDWQEAGYGTYTHTLVIGCVDNHLARREIAALKSAIWLDLGNHFASGQICIGNSGYTSWVTEDRPFSGNTVSHLPRPDVLLPDLLEPAPEVETSGLSCAELIERGTQHLLINQLMGTVGAAYVYNLLHRQPMDHFLSYVSVSPISIRNELISLDNLRSYIQKEQPVETSSE
jgi:PRTRC genetic system ThiF family protein